MSSICGGECQKSGFIQPVLSKHHLSSISLMSQQDYRWLACVGVTAVVSWSPSPITNGGKFLRTRDILPIGLAMSWNFGGDAQSQASLVSSIRLDESAQTIIGERFLTVTVLSPTHRPFPSLPPWSLSVPNFFFDIEECQTIITREMILLLQQHYLHITSSYISTLNQHSFVRNHFHSWILFTQMDRLAGWGTCCRHVCGGLKLLAKIYLS